MRRRKRVSRKPPRQFGPKTVEGAEQLRYPFRQLVEAIREQWQGFEGDVFGTGGIDATMKSRTIVRAREELLLRIADDTKLCHLSTPQLGYLMGLHHSTIVRIYRDRLMMVSAQCPCGRRFRVQFDYKGPVQCPACRNGQPVVL